MKPNYGDPYKRRSDMTKLLNKSPMSKNLLADHYKVPYGVINGDFNAIRHHEIFEIVGWENYENRKVQSYRCNRILTEDEVKPIRIKQVKKHSLEEMPASLKLLFGFTDFIPPMADRVYDADARHPDAPKRLHKVYIGSNWDAYGLLNIGF